MFKKLSDKFSMQVIPDLANDSNVLHVTATYYRRNLDEAIDEELLAAIRAAAKEMIQNDTVLREYIHKAIDTAVATLPLSAIGDIVRETVREEMAKANNPIYIRPKSQPIYLREGKGGEVIEQLSS